LPRNGNAATETIKALLLALAHDDPHDHAGRSTLYAHPLGRILRSEKFTWESSTRLLTPTASLTPLAIASTPWVPMQRTSGLSSRSALPAGGTTRLAGFVSSRAVPGTGPATSLVCQAVSALRRGPMASDI
jgi:hypothetical protein